MHLALPKGHKEMHLKVCHTREHCHLSTAEIRIGHGLDKPSLGNFSSCTGYCKNFLIATIKVFERFCIEIPKVKYCHEHTKGNFSRSSHKEVIYKDLCQVQETWKFFFLTHIQCPLAYLIPT